MGVSQEESPSFRAGWMSSQFLVDNGVDYCKESISGYPCLIVFNPKVIKHKIRASNITIHNNEYDRTIDI